MNVYYHYVNQILPKLYYQTADRLAKLKNISHFSKEIIMFLLQIYYLPGEVANIFFCSEISLNFFLISHPQVFVKGRRIDFMEHPEEALHWSNQVFPSTNDFQMMVKVGVNSNFRQKKSF